MGLAVCRAGEESIHRARRNKGPDEGRGVDVHDGLPAGVTFVSARPDQGSCDAAGLPTVYCSLGNIAANATAKIVINVIANDVGVLTSNADVQASGSEDPQQSDNRAAVRKTVRSRFPTCDRHAACANPATFF